GDAVTVDRDKPAGIRLAGFLIALGIMSGWSVTGNWVSLTDTIKDFVHLGWPALLLGGLAILAERLLANTSARNHSAMNLSAMISLAYIVIALLRTVIHVSGF